MSNEKCVLPMESYRLAQYSVQVPCYVCEGPNTFDAELCRHCQAPMALAHQANTQKVRPKMIAVVGSAGSGKTVYLGMLTDMLSRQEDGLQLLARGAFSITLQQNTVSALAHCRFPDKTPAEPDCWHWVHCQVRMPGRRQPVELIVPDMAGESVHAEIEHPHTYPVIRSFAEKCCGVIVLIDAARINDGDQDQDFFAMKLLSYLSELYGDNKKGREKRPLALMFTKADRCEECFDDPAGFAEKKAPGMWQHCRERFPNHRFFAAGVAGACATVAAFGEGDIVVPLRIEPRGIVEPFQWLLEQLKW